MQRWVHLKARQGGGCVYKKSLSLRIFFNITALTYRKVWSKAEVWIRREWGSEGTRQTEYWMMERWGAKLSMVLIIQYPQPFLFSEPLDEGVSASKMGNCFSFLQQTRIQLRKTKKILVVHALLYFVVIFHFLAAFDCLPLVCVKDAISFIFIFKVIHCLQCFL